MTKIFCVSTVFILSAFGIYGQTVTGSYLNVFEGDTSIITLNSDYTFTLYNHYQASHSGWWHPSGATPEVTSTIYGTWSQKSDTITTHPQKIQYKEEKRKHRLARKSFEKDEDHIHFIFKEDCLIQLQSWTDKILFRYCKSK